MLVDGACSVYEHRPRACRVYDCRVFAATGVELDTDAKAEIAQRVRRWRFSYPTAPDRAHHDAVLAAARSFAADANGPDDPTQIALHAIETFESFL